MVQDMKRFIRTMMLIGFGFLVGQVVTFEKPQPKINFVPDKIQPYNRLAILDEQALQLERTNELLENIEFNQSMMRMEALIDQPTAHDYYHDPYP
jgi:hypothetical protein